MTVSLGASASKSFTVAATDTAIALGSGDVPVLATPRVIAWAEEITVAAIAGQLGDGDTTVGYKIRVDHLAPTLVGSTVVVVATVVEVDRMQVTFDIEVTEGGATAAKGTITRVMVNRDKFIDGAGG